MELWSGYVLDTETSDEALAEISESNPMAFVELYERYVERVQRYVHAQVDRHAEVDDLVSVVFLRALTRLPTYDPARGAFGVWLFAIARNAVRDHHRRNRRYISFLPLEIAEWIPARSRSPEATVLRRERGHELHVMMNRLTRDQRDAIALRYGAELSFAEIGEALDKSEAAAKMLVRRGLEALRRHMHEGTRNA